MTQTLEQPIGLASVERPLAGWGRYPVQRCRVYRPEKRAALRVLATGGGERTIIARGMGRSYGDTSLNEGGAVADLTRLNRFLEFNEQTGELRCEAGVTLDEIVEVMLPRGWFLPVTPGTKFVTVGGAIANDVHGKNHHRDGTFCRWVSELTLLTAQGETLICRPEGENADVFWATAGGIGLTGFIQEAVVRLQPVESAWVVVDYLRARDLEQSLAIMTETAGRYQYSVAWIDCLKGGAQLGRSVVMLGNHAGRDRLRPGQDPFTIARRRHYRMPVDLPPALMNRWTVGMFNAVFNALHHDASDQLKPFDPYFYPLDAIGDWNRAYGRLGMVQYQIMIPHEGDRGLVRVLERLSASGRASFLAVLKCMGPANPGLLSYPFPGYTLALDIPAKAGVAEFLSELDAIVLEYGGRLYTAKDATMGARTFAAMYPRLEEFRAIQRRLDPEGRLQSSMSRRLGITGGGGAA